MREAKLRETITELRKENTRLATSAGADTSAARARFRCLLAGTFTAIAFIVGGLLARHYPSSLAEIQGWIASIPPETMTWLASPPGMASITAGLAVLILSTCLLAALRSRLAFLPSTLALMAAAGVFGMIPSTNERILESRIVMIRETLDSERARADFAAIEVINAREAHLGEIRSLEARIRELRTDVAEQEKIAEDARRLVAFKDDLLRKRDAEVPSYLARITAATDEAAVLASENVALRETLQEKETAVSRLRRRLEDREQELRELRSDVARARR